MKGVLLTVGIVIAALLAVILLIILVVLFFVRKYMGPVAGVVSAIKDATDEVQNTPKSLNGTEGIHTPKIKADFPEFDLALVKSYVKSFALDYFAAMTAGQVVVSKFEKNCSHQLIDMMTAQAQDKNRYEQAKVHKVVVSDYRKSTYDVSVVFELAVEYRYNGKSQPSQYKYEVWYTYFLEDGAHQELSSMKCPHCGAPIEKVDRSYCPYCEYPLDVHEEAIVIDRIWKITDIKKC